MFKPLFISSLLFLAACGNVTSPTSFTPTQRLKNSETDIARLGISFNGSNVVVNCVSAYRVTCINRMQVLNEYISNAFDLFGSEESMTTTYKERTKSAAKCIDSLNADLKSDTAINCRR